MKVKAITAVVSGCGERVVAIGLFQRAANRAFCIVSMWVDGYMTTVFRRVGDRRQTGSIGLSASAWPHAILAMLSFVMF